MGSWLSALLRRWPWSRTARNTLACVDTAPWPAFTVFVVAGGQDGSLSVCLQALLGTAYPAQALRIVPISPPDDDHSGAIVKAYAHLFPERVRPYRLSAPNLSADAALREALPLAQGDLALVLGSHQLPGPGLFKQLARPFFDPEVGLVSGGANGREGQPVVAVRLSAVQAVGGWAGPGLSDVQQLARRLQKAGWTRVVDPQAVWSAAPPLRQPAAPGPAAPQALEPAPDTSTSRSRAGPVLMEHT